MQDQDALKEEVAALKEANTHLRETFDIGMLSKLLNAIYIFH